MPTPAEHYDFAEKAVETAAKYQINDPTSTYLLRLAQVHATLATATTAAQGATLLEVQPEPTRYCEICGASEENHAPGGSRFNHCTGAYS